MRAVCTLKNTSLLLKWQVLHWFLLCHFSGITPCSQKTSCRVTFLVTRHRPPHNEKAALCGKYHPSIFSTVSKTGSLCHVSHWRAINMAARIISAGQELLLCLPSLCSPPFKAPKFGNTWDLFLIKNKAREVKRLKATLNPYKVLIDFVFYSAQMFLSYFCGYLCLSNMASLWLLATKLYIILTSGGFTCKFASEAIATHSWILLGSSAVC